MIAAVTAVLVMGVCIWGIAAVRDVTPLPCDPNCVQDNIGMASMSLFFIGCQSAVAAFVLALFFDRRIQKRKHLRQES